jgi:hypothetical protein
MMEKQTKSIITRRDIHERLNKRFQASLPGLIMLCVVLMTIDTLLMLWLGSFDADTVSDLIFHVWVVVYLAMGVHACHKLKTLPPEPIEQSVEPEVFDDV